MKISSKIAIILLLSVINNVWAGNLIMSRSNQDFPETMLSLQESISQQGYTLSRVQRVDVGLTAMGYETDKYRVVFLGKTDEVHYLTDKYPTLIPYLPLKISIFAEGDQTLLVTIDPDYFHTLFPQQELKKYFHQWSSDLQAILDKTIQKPE